MKTNHLVPVVLLVPIITLSGCVLRKHGSESVIASKSTIPPAPSCAANEVYSGLIIEKAPGLERGKTGFSAEQNLQFLEPSDKFQVRLDLCIGEQPRFQQLVLVRSPSFNNVLFGPLTPSKEVHNEGEVVLPANKFEIRGLDEALFSEDWSKLEIDIRNNWNDGFLLKGWGQGADGFVTFHNWSWDAAKKALLPKDGQILAGRLVPGNLVNIAQKCTQGIYRETKVTLGTAKLEFEYCFSGGNNATEYRVLNLRVTDSAPFLTPEEQTVVITRPEDLVRVPEDEVRNSRFYGAPNSENRLYFDINHHNACDTFYLNLRHAQFTGTSSIVGATGGGWDGCAPGVVNSPRYQSKANGLLWTVKYKNSETWQKILEHSVVGHFFSNEN